MPEVGSPLVEFQDLAVSYGLVQALAGVSGAFPPGPTGLLGPNGAGKTTLLKTLLGFLSPDRGRMTAFGLDPVKQPLEVRRRIGYMPEVDCHLPGMTASPFVAFAGELSGLPRDEAISRGHEVLYYVGLGEARYRNVDTYSTGMKQRAKLAQALVHDPDLLLLDEPTNGLDPQGREEMLALIADVAARRQMSLVLCSHLLRDVERVCESVIVMNQGQGGGGGHDPRADRAQAPGLRRALQGRRRRLPHRPQGQGLRLARGGGRLPRLPPRRPRAGARVPHRARVRGAGAPPAPGGGDASRTCSCARSGTRCRPDADLRAVLPPLRGPRAALRAGPLLAHHPRGPAAVLAKRAFLALLLACFVPFVVRVVQVYVFTRFPEIGRVLPVDGRMFGEFLNQQIGFTVLLAIFGGAGLVANDLRTGAILVYLSRPLTRRDYVLGKLGVLLALNLAVTLVPGLLLYLVALGLAPDQFAKWSLLWIGPAIVLHSLVISLVMGLLALAVSALSRSARVAGLALRRPLGRPRDRAGRPHPDRRPARGRGAVLPGRTSGPLGNALFGIAERRVDAARRLARRSPSPRWPRPACSSCARACARWRS